MPEVAEALTKLESEVDDVVHLRFLQRHGALSAPFGSDTFGKRAESFARFFGTPKFLIGQTFIVAVWILLNATNTVHFDIYPFILLNLGFSLQAAYAAPLILLAQTRQADRDKALAEADAKHREAISQLSLERQRSAASQTEHLERLLEMNTQLTEQGTRLTERIEGLTREIHGNVCARPS